MLDCAIIGTGPAGLSAALTLNANKCDFVWIGTKLLSEKVRKAHTIRNYPGLAAVSGEEFAQAMQEQINCEKLPLCDESVVGVYDMGGYFGLVTDKGSMYDAKSVIMAVGVQSIKVIPGENELLGKGVSYCATCDGALYKGKTIAVISTSSDFEGEVEFLANIADKTYFYPFYKNASVSDKVNVLSSPVKSVDGEKSVSGITLLDGEQLSVDGVFFLKNSVSPSAILAGIAQNGEHIEVTRDMKTNIPGVFACGDCTGRPYQYAKAVGEGNIAAFSVLEFIRNK